MACRHPLLWRAGTPLRRVAASRDWHATLAEGQCDASHHQDEGQGREKTIARLVWFRNDLRLADNPALRHACAGEEPVAALFILSPTQWWQRKLAPARQRFILAQLDALGRELAALGIPLHLLRVETFAEVPAVLADLSRELGVSELYANQAIEIDELRRDQTVTAALAEQEIGSHWFNGCCVLPPGRVLTGSGRCSRCSLPSAAPGQGPRGGWLRHSPGPGAARCAYPLVTAGRAAICRCRAGELTADARWLVGRPRRVAGCTPFWIRRCWTTARPGLSGAGRHVRALPYLAAGIISPRQCVRALQQRLGYRPQSKAQPGFVWLNELIWREFYRHLLVLIRPSP